MKYRLGKKQKRAILETATGKEYLVFPQSKTEHVEKFLTWLNQETETIEVKRYHESVYGC